MLLPLLGLLAFRGGWGAWLVSHTGLVEHALYGSGIEALESLHGEHLLTGRARGRVRVQHRFQHRWYWLVGELASHIAHYFHGRLVTISAQHPVEEFQETHTQGEDVGGQPIRFFR